MLGAELIVEPGASVELPLDVDFEHGVLVDTGDVTVCGTPVGRAAMAYLPPGTRTLPLAPAGDGRCVRCCSAGCRWASRSSCGGTSSGGRTRRSWSSGGQWRPEIAARRAIGRRRGTRQFRPVVGYPGRPLPAPGDAGGAVAPAGVTDAPTTLGTVSQGQMVKTQATSSRFAIPWAIVLPATEPVITRHQPRARPMMNTDGSTPTMTRPLNGLSP